VQQAMRLAPYPQHVACEPAVGQPGFDVPAVAQQPPHRPCAKAPADTLRAASMWYDGNAARHTCHVEHCGDELLLVAEALRKRNEPVTQRGALHRNAANGRLGRQPLRLCVRTSAKAMIAVWPAPTSAGTWRQACTYGCVGALTGSEAEWRCDRREDRCKEACRWL
jgi:hypothetical protein